MQTQMKEEREHLERLKRAAVSPHYTLHSTPHTLHPTPYTLHPTLYTLRPTPCIVHPTPYTLHPKCHSPFQLPRPKPQPPSFYPCSLELKLSTSSQESGVSIPRGWCSPKTLNPKPKSWGCMNEWLANMFSHHLFAAVRVVFMLWSSFVDARTANHTIEITQTVA